VASLRVVHFCDSFPAIQKFLTIYDSSNLNVVIVNQDSIDFIQFLETAITDVNLKIVTIPKFSYEIKRILNFVFHNPRTYYKKNIIKLWDILIASDVIYLYHNTFRIEYFIILSNLKFFYRLNVKYPKFKSEDSSRYDYNYFSPSLGNLLIGFFLECYFTSFGVKMDFWFNGHTLTPRYLENLEVKNVNFPGWDQLRLKYGYRLDNFNEHSIVYFDDGYQGILDIYEEESFLNINQFFRRVLSNNKEITLYIKAHPYTQDIKSIELITRGLENQIKIIPTYIPAELIVDEFKKYYTIESGSIIPHLSKGNCYTLYHFLKFKKEDNLMLERILNDRPNINFIKNT